MSVYEFSRPNDTGASSDTRTQTNNELDYLSLMKEQYLQDTKSTQGSAGDSSQVKKPIEYPESKKPIGDNQAGSKDRPEVFEKRGAPPEVPPVEVGNSRFTPTYNIDVNNGFTASLRIEDKETGKVLGEIPLYNIKYDQDMETDVQDVYLRSLSVNGNNLVAVDERGRKHFVPLKAR